METPCPRGLSGRDGAAILINFRGGAVMLLVGTVLLKIITKIS